MSRREMWIFLALVLFVLALFAGTVWHAVFHAY
jgi:hypothetical protein